MQDLTSENWIYKFDEFYMLQENASLVSRRRSGNIKARQLLKTAEKIAGFLSLFPFVRGVAISGSLSKNFADESSDIDFFIITAKNRLWLARTFMHIFKKFTFLFKKEDWFCMNYYIDEAFPEIREKNIFTATEVATLLPLRGIEVFKQFFEKNKWSREFLPNHVLRISYVEEVKSNLIKKAIEILFSHPLGNVTDSWLMNLTRSRWLVKTKKRKLNRRGIIMGMDVSKNYAKPDPLQFQKKLIHQYENNLVKLFRNYENKMKTTY